MPSPVASSGALEISLKKYAEDFALENHAAQVVLRGLSLVGVGFRPLLDHLIFRTVHLKQRAQEFLDLGYERDLDAKVFTKKGHGVEVLRKDCAGAILLEHPHDKAGLDWVAKFGDKAPCALAIRVEEIEEAVFRLEKQAVGFLRPAAGSHEDTLREIAAVPGMKDGKECGHLILVERHAGDQRFYAPDFWIN
ncbi:MAG TPA: hypothetical protein PLL75_05705 [Candidatus Omnitrophota bacterium]|nr:hypothetical protein [Candidatus Omnitrophota bacterium]HPS37203.1 hypothetical protein [Candidatus Omnitrophota bacterium]